MESKTLIPLCPDCDGLMTERRGRNGAFWGCLKYPACRGTRNIVKTEGAEEPVASAPAPTRPRRPAQSHPYAPIKIVAGSEEQEAIWEYINGAEGHLVVSARAGTGKTFTMIQACLRNPKRAIQFIAFNKHIATEAQGKLIASNCRNVTASTYHSLGYRMLRAAYPNTQIDEYKTSTILEKIPVPSRMPASFWNQTLSLTRRLAAFSKNYMLDPDADDFQSRLEEIADHHNLDLTKADDAIDMVPYVLAESKRQAPSVIDYDDMIWLPVSFRLPAPYATDLLIVDEAQDTNLCQQELAMLACPTGRIVIVGDPYQAIYGFRGADTTAMPRMKERLAGTPRGVEERTLTITRRCPVSHVKLAQAIVPDIQAMDDAPEGVIESMGDSEAAAFMQPGDLVICRVNAKLIPMAYTLLKRGIKPVVRGRDIGQGLLQLITKLERKAANIPAMIVALQNHRAAENERLAPLGDKAAGRVAALNDRCDCLQEMLQESESIPELKDRVESLFADFDDSGKPKGAVVLGTVHRTKGLEAERIFVLETRLLPHPMAKKPWEHKQEANLAYVAVTRSKYTRDTPGTIVFCGAVPSIYNYAPAEAEDEAPEQPAATQAQA